MYTGTYGAGTTAENALNTALMQYPEIARTLISQYPRYSATYLLERTGRYAKEKVLGDNSFEWKVMGRYNTPTYCLGWISTDGVSWASEAGAGAGSGAAAANADKSVDAADADGDVIYLATDGDDSDRTGNFLNKWDMVRFQSGAIALVVEGPTSMVALSAAPLTVRRPTR